MAKWCVFNQLPLFFYCNYCNKSGGPGCSSLDGLLYELGPFHVNNSDNTLYPNPYSWNLNASIIFLESPICVGFSYTDDMNCTANDNTTADDNYHALIQFFTVKFPEYLKHDFFIMGESYAGVYGIYLFLILP